MKKPRQVLALFAIFAILAALILISMLKTRESVQQSLDAACGRNAVLEREGSYNHDPIFSGSSPKAYCYENITSKRLVCECRIP
jgi:hypothetical protein